MLKVSVDMKRGVYVVRGDNGDKAIQVPMRGNLDKGAINNARQEIGSKKWIPSEKLNLIDVGVYKALREYDRTYETDYANKYIDVTSKQIPYASTAEKKRQYEKRATEIKSKEFLNNGISVEYNLSLFSGFKNMSIRERLHAIRVALTQKQNGARVQFSNNKQLLLEAPSEAPVIIENKTQTIEAKPEIKLDAKLDTRTAPQQSIQPPTQQPPIEERVPSFEEMMNIFKPIPEDPKPSSIEFTSIPKTTVELNATPKITETKGETIPKNKTVPEITVNPVAPVPPTVAPTVEEQLNGATDVLGTEMQQGLMDLGNTKSEENRMPQLAKKTVSRSKANGASKKAYRDAQKKLYQQQLKEKAEKKAKAREERALTGTKPTLPPKREPKKPPVAPVLPPIPPKTEPKKPPIAPPVLPPKIEPANPKLGAIATIKSIIPSKMAIKKQGEVQLARFTGKIKEKAEVIRSKKLTPKQRKIAGAVTLVVGVALTASIAASVTRYTADVLMDNYKNNQTNIPQIEQVVQVSQENDTQEGISRADYKQIRIRARGEEKAEANVAIEQSSERNQETGREQEDVKVQEDAKEQEATKVQEAAKEQDIKQEEQDSKAQYLSSIKVGSALNINNGKFFETPEGTGNYGHFDSYKDGVKTISMIEIMTRDGYKIVKDSNLNLYQLKQQYPDAKFSYHIVFERADGSKTTLGWLTESSLEQNRVDQQVQHNEDVDR